MKAIRVEKIENGYLVAEILDPNDSESFNPPRRWVSTSTYGVYEIIEMIFTTKPKPEIQPEHPIDPAAEDEDEEIPF